MLTHDHRERSVWWISFAVIGLIGTVWALASPLMSVPDEPAHAIKGAAMWRGELRGELVDLPPGDPAGVPSQVVDRVPRAYADLHDEPACFKGRPAVTASCTPAIGTDDDIVQVGSPAGTYPPLFYVVAGWPSRILDPSHALRLMRICSVALCAALLASALVSARALGRTGLAVLGVTAALTPMAVFLVGSVNPNGLEITAAIATGVVLLDVLQRPGRVPTRLLVRAVVVGSCLVAARPLSPLFFVLVVGVVALAALTRRRLVELVTDPRGRLAAAVLAVVAVLSGLLMVVDPPPLAGVPRPDLTFGSAVSASWDLLPFRTRQMVGLFGWLDTAPPEWLWHLWIAGVAVLVVLGLALDTTVRRRVALVVAVALAVVVPTVVEAAQAHRIGLYWQGRYSLPVAVLVPVVAAWMVADAPGVVTRLGRRLGVVGGAVVAVGAGLAQLYSWAFALSRYVVGEPTGAFSFVDGDGWRPPLGSTALFALALLAFTAYAWWTVVLATAGEPANRSTTSVTEEPERGPVDEVGPQPNQPTTSAIT